MGKKILIAEDNTSLAQALQMSLEKEGYEVFLAENGEEGLALAEDKLPDLILCDINMPKMDGFEMIKRIRKFDWGANLDVIILTNFSDEQIVFKALSFNVFHYLVKSDCDLEQIVEKVKKYLKNK
ncbi:MAG: response regulator [Candidatus Pacebacteria bacterium]|nr:response regulator [Candidatus Paceibacterota bacterium]